VERTRNGAGPRPYVGPCLFAGRSRRQSDEARTDVHVWPLYRPATTMWLSRSVRRGCRGTVCHLNAGAVSRVRTSFVILRVPRDQSTGAKYAVGHWVMRVPSVDRDAGNPVIGPDVDSSKTVRTYGRPRAGFGAPGREHRVLSRTGRLSTAWLSSVPPKPARMPGPQDGCHASVDRRCEDLGGDTEAWA